MERFSFVYSLIGYDENLHCSMVTEKVSKTRQVSHPVKMNSVILTKILIWKAPCFLTFFKASANFPILIFLFAILLVKADRTRDKANRMNVTM